MPRLLIFAPCEKVIFDDQNNASLIGLLQQVTVTVPSAEKIEENAAIPMRWQLFSLWLKEDGDEDKQFEQYCEVTMPDGRHHIVARTAFELKRRTHQLRLQILGFPIPKTPGETVFRLFIVDGSGAAPREVAVYPISIRHSS